jgi:plastocyanin
MKRNSKYIKYRFIFTALFLFFLVGSAYGAETKVHIVKIKDFNFHPHDLIIKQGETVTWINEMPYGHWVISGADMKHDGRYFSPLLLKNHKFSYTFDEPVVQDYYCPIHSMQGRITVLEVKGAEKKKAPKKRAKKRRRRSRRR